MLLAPLLLFATAAFGEPAPELIRLQGVLEQEQKAGAAQRPDYPAFVAKFRQDLDAGLKNSPKTAENESLHAFILSRLDAKSRAEALTLLADVELRHPDDPTPTKARGRVHFDGGEFRDCQSAAESVLKKNTDRGEAPDQEAVRLLHSCKGRAGSVPAPGAATQTPGRSGASHNGSSSAGYTGHFSQSPSRSRGVDVPAYRSDSNAESGRSGLNQEVLERKIVGAVDSKLHLSPSERNAAAKATRQGIVGGAIVGAGIFGAVGSAGCGPALSTGAGYVVCIGAFMTGGALVGAPTGGFAMGFSKIYFSRMIGDMNKLFGKDDQESE
jgi:hypothetical protein